MTHVNALRVLALYPTSRGFGFAMFDARWQLIDWGIKGIRDREKNIPTMRAMTALIEQCSPTVIVFEDTRQRDSRRHERIRILLQLLAVHLAKKHVKTKRFTRKAVLHHFGVTTKHELAETIALAFPALALRLPPKRKPWMSEDARQSLFDAAALGLMALGMQPGT